MKATTQTRARTAVPLIYRAMPIQPGRQPRPCGFYGEPSRAGRGDSEGNFLCEPCVEESRGAHIGRTASEWPVNACGLSNIRNIGTAAVVCGTKGRLHFARSPIESPVYPTEEGAISWCIAIIEENAARMGPSAKALIEW